MLAAMATQFFNPLNAVNIEPTAHTHTKKNPKSMDNKTRRCNFLMNSKQFNRANYQESQILHGISMWMTGRRK